MIATLTFDLSDPDDEIRHAQCLAGRDALLALWRIRERTMEHLPYEALVTVLDEFSLDLDKLLP